MQFLEVGGHNNCVISIASLIKLFPKVVSNYQLSHYSPSLNLINFGINVYTISIYIKFNELSIMGSLAIICTDFEVFSVSGLFHT